jgi:hypothetical protein
LPPCLVWAHGRGRLGAHRVRDAADGRPVARVSVGVVVISIPDSLIGETWTVFRPVAMLLRLPPRVAKVHGVFAVRVSVYSESVNLSGSPGE